MVLSFVLLVVAAFLFVRVELPIWLWLITGVFS
jgi:hypothetical protein